MASDLIERLTNPEATEQLIGMVSYEASTWRVEPNRERDAVEEAGFLDAVAHTLEALRTALAIERERAEKAEVRRNAHHEGELHAIERAKAAEAALAEAKRLLTEAREANRKLHRRAQLSEAVNQSAEGVLSGWVGYLSTAKNRTAENGLFRIALGDIMHIRKRLAARFLAQEESRPSPKGGPDHG